MERASWPAPIHAIETLKTGATTINTEIDEEVAARECQKAANAVWGRAEALFNG